MAEVNGQLQQFLFSIKKKQPNMTNLLTTGMPKGRGRKGGTAPRTRKATQPITTRIVMSAPMTTTSVNVNAHTVNASHPVMNVAQSPIYGDVVQHQCTHLPIYHLTQGAMGWNFSVLLVQVMAQDIPFRMLLFRHSHCALSLET